jgi:hypothetical protein
VGNKRDLETCLPQDLVTAEPARTAPECQKGAAEPRRPEGTELVGAAEDLMPPEFGASFVDRSVVEETGDCPAASDEEIDHHGCVP